MQSGKTDCIQHLKEISQMTLRQLRVPRSISVLTLIAFAATAAVAQSSTTSSASAPGRTGATPQSASATLDVVTVTSRRRTENIQDVPLSVTAVTAAQIEQEGASSLQDLGFSIGNYTSDAAYGNPARSTPIIRGVANSSGGGNGGTSAVYIDDVYVGDTSGNAMSLMDVERVEVLRGPQGTLFGKNSISGAVNVTTMRPSKVIEGSVGVTIGNYGLVQPSAFIAGPLVDGVLYGKVALLGTSRDGFETVLGTSEKVNDQKNTAFRGGFLVTPSKNTDIGINFDSSKDTSSFGYADAFRDRNPAGQPYGSPIPVGAIPGVPVPLYQGAYNAGIAKKDGDVFDGTIPGNTPGKPNTSSLQVQGVSLKVNHRIGDVEFVSITAGRKYSSASKADGDNGPLDIFYSDTNTEYKQTSQEFRFIGQGKEIDWVAGFFYFKGERDVQKVTNVGKDFLNDARLLSPALGGFQVTTGALAGILCGGAALGSNSVCTASQYEPDFKRNTSTAFYGSATYKATSALSVTAGIRFNNEKVEQDYIPAYVVAPFFGLNGAPASQHNEKTESDVSPSISVGYKLSAATNVYANYSKGYRSGFINSSDGKDVKPETMQSYEGGLKTTWLDGAASTNFAVYRMEYADMQRTRALNFGQQFVTDNAAKATIQGLELDTTIRATRGLDFTLSAGYNDAKYDDYKGARISNDNGSSSIVDLSGATMLFAPKYTIALGTRYETAIGGFTTQFGGQVQHRTDFQVGDGPATIFQVAAQTNVNLFVTLAPADSSWKGTVRVKNLSNKRYYLGPNQSADGTDYAVLSAPRTITFELRKDF